MEDEIRLETDKQDLPFKHSSHQLCIKKQKCFVDVFSQSYVTSKCKCCSANYKVYILLLTAPKK